MEDSSRSSSEPEDYLIKFITVGDVTVGKTTLIHRYVKQEFISKYVTTVGIDFVEKCFQYTPKINSNTQSHGILLQIWDISGNERFRSLATTFFRDSMGFLLIFDVTNEQSFHNISNWYERMKQKAYCENPDTILIGNKADLKNERVISYSRAKELADKLSLPYIETSVLTGENVKEAIDILVEKTMTRYLEAIDKSIFPIRPRIKEVVTPTQQTVKSNHPCYR